MSETVTITALSGDEEFTAYVARPAGSPRAAIVVIQEIFGVNAGIRRKCDRLAEDGYLAIAPDLFWRLEPKIELDPDVEAMLMSHLTRHPDGSSTIQLHASTVEMFIGGIDKIVEKAGDLEPVLLCPSALRPALRALLEAELAFLPVLCREEISPVSSVIHHLGRVTLKRMLPIA